MVEVVGFYTAKVLLPVISFGMIRTDHGFDDRKFGWFQFWRRDANRIVVHSNVAAAIGVFFWIAVLVALVALWR